MDKDSRVKWLDVMKGVTILMVVLGHARLELNFISRLCVGTHMPVFFFIGGVTLHEYDTFSSGVIHKLKALIYPYVTCSVMYLIVYGLYSFFLKDDMSEFWNMFMQSIRFEGYGVLWFLPTLFGAEVLMLIFLQMHLKKSMIICSCFVFVFMVQNMGGYLNGIGWFYVLKRTLLAGIFILAGYFLKDILLNKKTIPWELIMVSGGGYAYLCHSFAEWFTFDLHYAVIPNMCQYLLLAICGIITVMSVSMKIKGSFFSWIGENSLCIMCTHYPIIWAVRQFVDPWKLYPLFHQFVVAGIVILMEIGLVCVINKKFRSVFYFPQRVSVRKEERKKQ